MRIDNARPTANLKRSGDSQPSARMCLYTAITRAHDSFDVLLWGQAISCCPLLPFRRKLDYNKSNVRESNHRRRRLQIARSLRVRSSGTKVSQLHPLPKMPTCQSFTCFDTGFHVEPTPSGVRLVRSCLGHVVIIRNSDTSYQDSTARDSNSLQKRQTHADPAAE